MEENLTCGTIKKVENRLDYNHNVMIETLPPLHADQKLPFSYGDSHHQSKEPLTEEKSHGNLTPKVALAALVAFFTNSLPSGYNIGVVNTPEEIYKHFFNVSLNKNRSEPLTQKQVELLWSIAVSLLIVGAMVTSVFTGALANCIGRRGVILLNSTIGLVGMCLTWGSKYLGSVPVFMAGRLVAGFHTGIASSIVPMYLMEVAPPSLASCLGVIHVMGLNGGILIAQSLGLEFILGSEQRWPLLFFVNAVFITLGLLSLYFIPESPVYLFVIRKQEKEAIEVLEQIRRKPISELTDDISELKHEQKNKECNNMSFFTLLGHPDFRRNLIIVCTLHAGQQLCGINAVFYYSTATFRGVGLSDLASQYGSIGCAALNVICALLSMQLIRSFSLRKLILVSTIGTTIALIVLTITMTFKDYMSWLNYATILTILIYVGMFAIGQGPIPFMIGGELFDSGSMAVGLSCGCFTNWFCNCIVAITFPMLVMAINQYVFIIFVVFDALLLVFIIFMVPETKGKRRSGATGQSIN